VSVADREQLRELASLHALGVLSAEERAALAAAMAADAELAAEVRQLEDTAGALGGVAAQVDPPARLRARVLAVAGIDDAGADGSAATTAASTAGSRAGRAADGSAAVRSGSALPGWLAAAAALVLASGLGLWALQLRGALDTMNARVDRAEAEVVRIQRTLGEAQQQTANLQAHNSVLFAPDTLRVDLAGEGPAPGSKARAFMSRHRGLVVAADELPALPADKVYQVWVVPGDQSAPISAGLLAPDATGHAALFFAMPANAPVVAALAVTVEPAGGRPSPTGDKALVGVVPVTTTVS
jgi:anti-sigma-K factor RskA